MLKRKLTKDEFDALDEGKKSLYKENSSRAGEYVLDVEDSSEQAALVRSKAAEKARADAAEARVAELTTENESLTSQLSTSKPDLEKIGNEYKAKEKSLTEKHKGELAAKDKQIAAILIDRTALELATKISTVPELVVDAIKRRLKVGVNEAGEPVTEVLDAGGLATTQSVEDLGKEFVANPKYGAIMVGSKATGGSAIQGGGGGSATQYKGKNFSDLTEVERTAWHKEDPAGFKAASDANRNAKF